ncbi:glycoside hydrolase family 13 protein [Cohnella herbarum]|uniref:Alpha-glycosidase n=1 Tax=Cohnella herbarum TaxID=2728023 RepID=A0A7Z2VIE8_9BACL|nr:glycoside hydrolase family 13 protein [Cohnella herbarum]QJD83808.1 alpha-glycosidase [Cohnella herbarum]
MQKEAIYHINDIPYLFTVGEHEVKIRIRAKRDEVSQCTLLHSDRYQPPGHGTSVQLALAATTDLHDYFEGVLYSDTGRIRYQFLLSGKDGTQVWYGEYGASDSRGKAGYFHCASVAASDEGAPPSWVKDAVVYQIFPDRFANGNPAIDPDNVRSWTSPEEPERDSFYGGDLLGIIGKLPYLHDLGINVIYMTPVFESPSNHKYDTTDYYSIDPHFGQMEDLKRLVKEAHALNMRVVLDAVFNHAGDRFFAFQDLLINGADSEYKDWFFVDRFPIVQSPSPSYESFGIHSPTMPKLNTGNPEVMRYLLDVAKYWIKEVGIDGWRLDVANEVDHRFWRRLREEIKGIDRELLLVGEIMHYAGPWLRGEQFDGVMNYLFRDAVIGFFAKQSITARAFVGQIESIRMQYTDHANSSMFNLIGSHDTERFLTACAHGEWGWSEKQEVARLKLAALFQLTYTGMPFIYYGDEVGMTGGEDPGCRKPMIWDDRLRNTSVLTHYKELISLRKQYAALREGEFKEWFVDEATNSFGFIRRLDGQCVGIVLNNSPDEHPFKLEAPRGVAIHGVDKLYGSDEFEWDRGLLTGSLSPYHAVILLLK